MPKLADAWIQLTTKGAATVNTALGQVHDSLTKISGTQLGELTIGKLTGLVAVHNVIRSMEEMHDKFLETVRVQRVLDYGLNRLGGSAAVTSDEVEMLATELEKITSFDDESIKEGAATLLKFGNVHSDVFKKALKAGVDFAAHTRKSLPEAMQILGMALEDPQNNVQLLRRGFKEFSQDTVQAVQETNDIMKAQDLILSEIIAKSQGAGVALADPWIQTKNSVDNAKEAVGEYFSAYFKWLDEAKGREAKKFTEGQKSGKNADEVVKAFPNLSRILAGEPINHVLADMFGLDRRKPGQGGRFDFGQDEIGPDGKPIGATEAMRLDEERARRGAARSRSPEVQAKLQGKTVEELAASERERRVIEGLNKPGTGEKLIDLLTGLAPDGKGNLKGRLGVVKQQSDLEKKIRGLLPEGFGQEEALTAAKGFGALARKKLEEKPSFSFIAPEQLAKRIQESISPSEDIELSRQQVIHLQTIIQVLQEKGIKLEQIDEISEAIQAAGTFAE